MACTLIAIAVALSACHAAPRPATTPRLAAIQQLQRDLDTILTEPALERGYWGVLVQSLGDRSTLYAANARKLLMPASNLKIVTLAAAATRLGWDYSYETRVLAAGSIDAGVLHGDLIVVGSGDPSIGGRDSPATRVFEAWAEQLKAQGLRRIEGRIVGDDRAFDNKPLGAGWSWDDLSEGYASGLSALQFNENAVRATVVPGLAIGDAAIVTVEPPGSGLTIRNELRTVASGSTSSFEARRLPGSDQLELCGSVPLASPPGVHTLSVDNPTRFFVTALRSKIVDCGIDVNGPAVAIGDIRDTPSLDDATLLLSYRSPPLSALAATMMKVSQNLYAETLLKTIGAAAGTPTAETGRAVAESVVREWGVQQGALIMLDGSGMSRYSFVTPEALVTILMHVDSDERLRGPFESALPVAGRDGTLAHRMQGTAAEGNARAKTGSLSNVRAISGYVTTADGESLAFSIIANNFESSADVIDRAADAMVVRLAQFSRRLIRD